MPTTPRAIRHSLWVHREMGEILAELNDEDAPSIVREIVGRAKQSVADAVRTQLRDAAAEVISKAASTQPSSTSEVEHS